MSTIKKLFHRKSKDLSNAEQSPTNQRSRLRKSTGDANVRQQFLDDTVTHNNPEVRDFGNGGNGGRSISNVRKLSLRGVGRSSRNETAGSHDGPPQLADPMATSQPSRDLSQEMTALDLNKNNQAPDSSNTFRASDYSMSPDAVTRPSRGGYTRAPGGCSHAPEGSEYGAPTRKAVPRRELATGELGSEPATSTTGPTQPLPDRTQRTSLQKPLPTAPSGQPMTAQTSENLAHSIKPTAEEVVRGAQTNTADTEIIEKWAPAVVHETVHKDIHHVREEVITREIHTHDVYHRILPIIDVEVLPARHFLPVEGGGLVEISAGEVPARANQHWVIAETASKIPSDQAVGSTRREFSAREFPGKEGDKIEYITEQGIPRTEETWIHPPELESGGKETGQTWPMDFGVPPEGKERRRRRRSEGVKGKGKERDAQKRMEKEELPAGARDLRADV